MGIHPKVVKTSLKIKNVNLMLGLEERLGDHQSQRDHPLGTMITFPLNIHWTELVD